MDDSPLDLIKPIFIFVIGLPLLIIFGKAAVLFMLYGPSQQPFNPHFTLTAGEIIRYNESSVASVAEAFIAPKKTVPTSKSTPIHSENASVIRYLDNGFLPGRFETIAGTEIYFVNESGNAMQITIEPVQGTRTTPTTAPHSIGKDKVYAAMVPERGTYVFYNRNKRVESGTLVIR